MRIAVVHVGWPIQGYARDLVNGLVGQGHEVDIVATADDDRGLIDLSTIRGRVALLGQTGSASRLARRLRRGIASICRLPLDINPPAVAREADVLFAARQPYDLLVGVEKAGLEIAVRHGTLAGIPAVYYSLELYLGDHPDFRRFAWQRPSEIARHAMAAGTIIQDRFRWQVLQQANQVGGSAVFFLPVGIAAPSPAPPSPRRAPSDDDCRLLSFGVQGRTRLTGELIEMAPRLPAGMRLRLHGPSHEPWVQRRERGPLPPNLELTTQLLPEAALPDLLASADIGLALYRQDVANDRLTAYSSQKVALYLQAGLPIIAFRSEPYEELMARFHCGELIDSLDDLPAAAERIRVHHDAYSENAHKAYAAIYQLDRYWQDLAAFLTDLLRAPIPEKP